LHRPTFAFTSMSFGKTEEKYQSPYATYLLTTTQPLQLRPPNEVSYAQRRHEVESLRTVARYVRWLCIGQLGVHQVFKERVAVVCRCDGLILPRELIIVNASGNNIFCGRKKARS